MVIDNLEGERQGGERLFKKIKKNRYLRYCTRCSKKIGIF